ncbi:MAG: gliding motility-associated C-terminal domain-containing protein, partial [Flavobacteriales bacterium]|nr:gliding motility-associated C-terminal domain-containing protein [Flavobacteriales bacterium]
GCTNTASVSVTVNPLPTVTASASPTSICVGQSSTLTASGANTYNWSTGGTGTSINVSPTGSTTYTVTGTSTAGCTNTASVSVTVNPLPTVTASASPTSICSGQSSTLTASGANTYNWSTSGTGTSINVSPTGSTTYTVTGTSTAGCTNTASVSVTVNPSPTVTVNNPSICAGQSATLTATGAAVYSWSTGGTGTSINVSPTGTTTYTVTGTNAVGCTSTASGVVTVNPLPNVSITASPTSVCPGNTSSLTASGASTYSWSTGGTGTSINVNPINSTTYTVTGTSTAGCTNTANVNVTVLPGPIVTTTGATICEGQTANITASGATNYSWDNSMTGSSINVSPTSTTTYTVSGTDGSGCTGIATAIVTVNPLPTIIVTDQSICEGQSATLSASGASTYSWSNGATGSSINVSPSSTITYTVSGTDVNSCENTADVTLTVNPSPVITIVTTPDYCDSGNGTAIATASGATAPYQYNWNTIPAQNTDIANSLTAGNYTVTITDDNGCSNTATATVEAQAGFSLSSSSEPEHCGQMDGSAQVIVSNAVNPLTYTWSHNASLNSTDATALSSGTYTVTVSDGECTRIEDILVSSMNGPIAGFILNPTVISLEDPVLNVIDASTGASTWFYDFDDGSTSTLQNTTHTYNNEGEYIIMQVVTDNFGCTDTAWQSIIVNESFTFFIPNAFSPNGDGKNDLFHPYGIGIDGDTWVMRIYDRWGHTVFYTTDINQPWDGNYDGDVNKTSQGVYSYHIMFKTSSGKDKEFFGRVTKLP